MYQLPPTPSLMVKLWPASKASAQEPGINFNATLSALVAPSIPRSHSCRKPAQGPGQWRRQ